MWERWDPAAIDGDFARIQWLNANAVRVIVQANTFGFPQPSPLYLARLRDVVDLAAAHGLRVELTLFDWWRAYRRIPASRRWAAAVVGPYAGDPRIAAIELKNEIDPADAAATAWASRLLPYVRGLAGGIPVTISVTGLDPAARLQQLEAALGDVRPDFWTVHFYEKPELAYRLLAAAKAVAAPLPLFVGETGYYAADTDPRVRTAADREDEQMRFVRTVSAAASLLGLPAVAPWILSDFARGATAQRLPAAEYQFGLFRVNGRPKPAAFALRSVFGAPSPDLSFNGDFEQAEAGTPTPEPSLWRRRGAADFALDGAVAHGGASSVSIGAVRGFATSHAFLWTQPIAPWVEPGAHVTLTAWARGEDATGANGISLIWFDRDRNRLGHADSPPLAPGTSDWTQLVVDADAPPGAAYLRIQLTSDGDTGRVWFDDVALAAS